jgi:gliding motility-associated lipoprotein GldD
MKNKCLNFKALRIVAFACIIMLGFSFISCGGDDDDAIAPKPRAYFRLSFPEKKYVKYDSLCPFTCEIPAYSKMENDKDPGAQPCWLNLVFPHFNGIIHFSYMPVNGNIQKYLEQTYTLASKHQIKSSGIEEQQIAKPQSRVYGLVYNIQGNAASSIQFFLTDSTKHFIRGALYFYAPPNTDSISPVVDFIRKDIYHMIETFEWKKDDNN